jgi:dihydroxyacetone kinase-like predicted kinase
MAHAAAAQLEEQKARVNALNVFPVPDGDTGTNMALTLGAAVQAVMAAPSSRVDELADVAAQGALMGARGNSGVILSQFLRGFADGLAGMESTGPLELAQAFVKAAEAAYGAVIRPVEGTILTVGKEAAAEALRAAQEGCDIPKVLERALAAAADTLSHTPDLLATLREAGVVDAGGEGLLVAARGAYSALNGSIPDLVDSPALSLAANNAAAGYTAFAAGSPASNTSSSASADDFAAAAAGTAASASGSAPAAPPAPASTTSPDEPSGIKPTDITYRYCTEFLVRGANIDMDAIRRDLADLGDSQLVVGQPDLAKVHIHTNHPGLVLELCGVRGELMNIHISNMQEQNLEAARLVEAVSAPAPKPAEVAVVAVANGAGCIRLLTSLGAAVVVEGGQTLNPSTEEILAAVQRTGARSALILPNNGNVLMTARQAAHLASIPVTVVPTRSFCQGVAALLRFSPEESLSENAKRMEEAIGEIASAEVTVAVRDARVDSRDIRAGEYLGISAGKIRVTGSTRREVLCQLVEELADENSSLVTLYYGEGVSEAEAQESAAELRRLGLDVEVYEGGQPVYDYLLSVE